jgi:hypothetical protein
MVQFRWRLPVTLYIGIWNSVVTHGGVVSGHTQPPVDQAGGLERVNEIHDPLSALLLVHLGRCVEEQFADGPIVGQQFPDLWLNFGSEIVVVGPVGNFASSFSKSHVFPMPPGSCHSTVCE